MNSIVGSSGFRFEKAPKPVPDPTAYVTCGMLDKLLSDG